MMPQIRVRWLSRWKREETEAGSRRVLRSREGYLLVHYDRPLPGLSPIVYACRDRQTVISRHRKPGAALKACEQDLRQHTPRRPK